MIIFHKGVNAGTYGGLLTPAEAAALIGDGAQAEDITLQGQSDLEKLFLIRSRIATEAGDDKSLLGTTSDAASLATLGICALTVAVAQGTSWASFKSAYMDAIAAMAGDQDMAAISAAFLAKVGDGTVKVPALAKGIDRVVEEIEERSTAVSEAIAGG